MNEHDLEMLISELGLSPRTAAVLERAGLHQVRDLIQRTQAELLKTRGIARPSLREITKALGERGLALGMLPRIAPTPLGVLQPPPYEAAIRVLDGDPTTVDALARGEVPIWQQLVEYLLITKPLPSATLAIGVMLQREPGAARWLELLRRALSQIDSKIFATTKTATTRFLAWFGDGIVAARGATAPVSVEIRFERELCQVTGVEVARDIVADARSAGMSSGFIVDALLLHARRSAEIDDHVGAIESLLDAEALIDAEADAATRSLARRMRASNLLVLRRFDEAFAILDHEMSTRAARVIGGSFRPPPIDKGWGSAIQEAAQVAVWAAATTPEWVRALGGMAQRADDAASKRRLWARFERSLEEMVAAAVNPGSALEVVVRQASQRGLRKTASAVLDLAKERGIQLVDNPHFG